MKPLFSREYVAMALSGDYRMGRSEVGIRRMHVVIEKMTIVGYLFLYPLAKLPIVGGLWEMICRSWGQNVFGFFIRSAYWKTKLKEMGTNVFFDYGVHIWAPRNVKIGSDVHIDHGVIIWGTDGFVKIGSRINIGCYSLIQGRGGVIIEDDCGISPHVAIYSSTHYQWFPDGRRMAASPMGREEQYILAKPVVIRHHSYIKYGSLVTHGQEGIVIGPYGFILPNSLVKDDVAPETMAGGNPAKYMRDWGERRNVARKSDNQLMSDGNDPHKRDDAICSIGT